MRFRRALAVLIVGVVLAAGCGSDDSTWSRAAPPVATAVPERAAASALTTSQAVYRLPTTSKVIALTFDAGSDKGYTNLILDTLALKHVKATFSVTGRWAELYPGRVRRMAAEGHVVINHSYSHWSFTGVSSTQVLLTTAARQADLRHANTILKALIGHTTKPYWRPPYGDYDASVLADVGAIGYRWTVMWTVDTLGWKGLSTDAIVARVVAHAEPGAIIVMHVGSQSQDGPALARVIRRLRRMGYSFTTIAAAFPA